MVDQDRRHEIAGEAVRRGQAADDPRRAIEHVEAALGREQQVPGAILGDLPNRVAAQSVGRRPAAVPRRARIGILDLGDAAVAEADPDAAARVLEERHRPRQRLARDAVHLFDRAVAQPAELPIGGEPHEIGANDRQASHPGLASGQRCDRREGAMREVGAVGRVGDEGGPEAALGVHDEIAPAIRRPVGGQPGLPADPNGAPQVEPGARGEEHSLIAADPEVAARILEEAPARSDEVRTFGSRHRHRPIAGDAVDAPVQRARVDCAIASLEQPFDVRRVEPFGGAVVADRVARQPAQPGRERAQPQATFAILGEGADLCRGQAVAGIEAGRDRAVEADHAQARADPERTVAPAQDDVGLVRRLDVEGQGFEARAAARG